MATKNKVAKTFYRRPLPDVCVAFASDRGKQLFTGALSSGHMNGYFTLASQYRTQDEPSYCGLSSLVMVLNALAVDPGHVWKGVFRWYHENMLDCCTPLDEIRKSGISMDNLMCLALCNQLHGELKRVPNKASVKEFREDVKLATKRDDQAIIMSYSRGVLGQTGTGHFSPIGGYNESEDMVLVLDVARFKYPPYWTPLKKLWDAMNTPDLSSGLQRGYMVLWREDTKTIPNQPPLLFKISQRLNASHSIMKESGNLLIAIDSFLSQKYEESEDLAFKSIIKMLMLQSFKHLASGTDTSFLTVRVTPDQLLSEFPDQLETIEQMIFAIEETSTCKKITELFPQGICCKQALFSTPDMLPIPEQNGCCLGPENSCKICLKHFLTIFVLSFPMNTDHPCPNESSTSSEANKGTYRDVLRNLVKDDLKGKSCECKTSPEKRHRVLLYNEITQLRKQFEVLMNACEY